ncbi:hypothetical protein B0I72DRAFT_78784 [Yarrowia lipolytica]|uniref:YALI0A15598p n=2 Tax=Yarrowia lipolytica TaxID=4952 RepID=Q6CGW2_YARLI|nr:YALI0A15598p [Yarrowia lipolytica CLIB122]KAB8280670.1 hypothetical protein BKA91DRAFT_154273 [Yarrowia lipolytica]RDW23086.1 hypothetical protein B0I71DRAFT_149346 [Yarrowia lipolytica]RDW34181.1 hypothetical protein B0I72DRAFT_78784 [Yarrowia lipolytica]RDW37424.1 hypothetical protein B0I73DRAFT_87789 [Yarrowia lipolytica]RDW45051.1 hypothetical protein B0I74DRAFT_85218 [Yarrowia lipolytica]|eukprot:XP_500100.1 YALI0A15598p [Yarrowia lipolytica CLIB122]
MNHSQYDNLNWATVRGRNDGVLNRFVALHGIVGALWVNCSPERLFWPSKSCNTSRRPPK